MDAPIYEEMAAIEATHWWFVARRRILSAVITSMGLRPDARIIELGCGTGGNLEMLARFGSVTAVEMNDFARTQALSVAPGRVLSGHLPDNLPDLQAADLVCLLDVLEHLDDDVAALRRITSLLRPGGRLLVTVPAYQWLFGSHDRAHHHRRRYTQGGLRSLAQATGWRVERIGYFNSLLFPLVGLQRLLQRALGHAESSDAQMPSRHLNAALTAVFGVEARWMRHSSFPFGVSVLAVMRPGP